MGPDQTAAATGPAGEQAGAAIQVLGTNRREQIQDTQTLPAVWNEVAEWGEVAVKTKAETTVEEKECFKGGTMYMTAGNGTGPMGMGPRTGRAAGFCAGFGKPGFMNRRFSYGWAGGRGFCGRGGGRWWTSTPDYGAPAINASPAAGTVDEISMLKRQAKYLEGMLENIKKRLDALTSNESAEKNES